MFKPGASPRQLDPVFFSVTYQFFLCHVCCDQWFLPLMPCYWTYCVVDIIHIYLAAPRGSSAQRRDLPWRSFHDPSASAVSSLSFILWRPMLTRITYGKILDRIYSVLVLRLVFNLLALYRLPVVNTKVLVVIT